MDLVDIEKVLDDLELDEDEKRESTTVATKPPQQQFQQHINAYPTMPTSETNNNDKPSKSKSFVNITNVFSSLQEYVNVDIDHIIRAAETLDMPKTCEEVRNEVDKQGKLQLEEHTKDKNDDEEEYTEGCPDGAITSTSSITTSSPSSFSSGPSPGSSNESSDRFTSDEKLNPASTLGEYYEEKCNLPNTRKLDESRFETTDAISDEDVAGDNHALSSSQNLLTGVKNADDNSLELGLSSISSCLYNENTSSSLPGLSNDLCKLDALSSIPSSTSGESDEAISEVEKMNVCDDVNSKELLNVKIINDQEIESAVECKRDAELMGTRYQPCHKPVKDNVVGFGSTMDEISDTELDSILQEIDSDFQVFNKMKTFEAESDLVLRATGSIDAEINNQKEYAIADAKDLEKSSDTSHQKHSDDGNYETLSDREDNHDNIANIDNFSQASTIEFAESRVQTDFDHEPGLAEQNVCDNISANESIKKDEVSCTKAINDQSCTSAILSSKNGQQRPNSLDIPVQSINITSTAGQTPPAPGIDDENNAANSSSEDLSPQSSTQDTEEASARPTVPATITSSEDTKLGKVPPFWIPDSEAPVCMQCQAKFSLIRRRHHCRACGLVLCSLCCSQKAKLEFLGDTEVRVCVQCHLVFRERSLSASDADRTSTEGIGSGSLNRPPNPNNPMEYCSMIPPHQQVTGKVTTANPISVMVPVGVLKREGVPPRNNRKDKNVIFSDGIRPGCDLAELDDNWDDKTESTSSNRKSASVSKKYHSQPGLSSPPYHGSQNSKQVLSSKFQESDSFIPVADNALPPIHTKNLTESELTEVANNEQLITRLKSETLHFALQRNFYVNTKIVKLKCCVNKTVINFSTCGMHHVGQDEIVILLEYMENVDKDRPMLPKDIFVHLYQIYCDAYKGRTVNELGFSVPSSSTFLGSKDHGGFLYIRPSFQCLHELEIPEAPFLIGILIHRYEVPWARIFPLRLMLRLGAQYRYYPCPHVSVQFRDAVYGDIAQTIINFLADFRNYSYTIATIRGLYIHMEERKTIVFIPKNRHDQIVKALNNSSDHILALGANLSKKADGHLVCIQNMESNCAELHTYSTQAINIQGQPRKVTGASFLVLNGALKSTSGLQGKCSIVEDGLMVQILPAKMTLIRTALQSKQDVEIICGPIDADEVQTETVNLIWADDDVEFNIDVKSPIDGKKMDGIASIRVHSGLNYSNANHIIRWTEVFIIQMGNDVLHNKEVFDVQKVSEEIAKSTSIALVPFFDLLAASECTKIGLRITLHQDNVCYETGSLNTKLAPLYMKALDNELIPTLHQQTTNLRGIDKPIILELIFYILDKY